MSAVTLTRPGEIKLAALPPLSLYIHIPWCIRKCPYCDFNSFEKRPESNEQRYVDALIADLEATLPLVWGRRVNTIFFGGGTPSLFAPESIDAILTAVRARLPLVADAEVTLEANPGTFEFERFAAFRAAGVNRLSIGIQSFNETHLKALGRVHDATEARRAIDIALTHFDNVNLDIMYALPEQSMDQALADVREAIRFAPQHISAYHLTLEPNTLFHRYPPKLPDDDAAADMQEAIETVLTEAGYQHYETSAFAKPGLRCKHNLNYWQFGDYIGIGAGAHGKLSFTDRIVRSMRHKQPTAFIDAALAGDAVQETRLLTAQELPFEFMMNALRLRDGFTLADFELRTGQSIARIGAKLQAAEREGLIERYLQRVWPTRKGERFLNELLQRFL